MYWGQMRGLVGLRIFQCSDIIPWMTSKILPTSFGSMGKLKVKRLLILVSPSHNQYD